MITLNKQGGSERNVFKRNEVVTITEKGVTGLWNYKGQSSNNKKKGRRRKGCKGEDNSLG